MTGACLPIAASAADVRAVIEGFDPLRFESVEDLGAGRMAITWVLRGPLREAEFDVRLDGHLDVESATAASQPMPTMVPPPPVSLLPTQPVITFGGRGSHLVRLSLTSIPQRDLDDTYFEDNVVIRVIVADLLGLDLGKAHCIPIAHLAPLDICRIGDRWLPNWGAVNKARIIDGFVGWPPP